MRKKGRTAQSEPVFTGPGVCELLKTTRERAGGDLQTVSQVLRIRLVYLQAIEAGHYEELPGKTYVVGFVRAYAEHLGLDSEEVVKRFKAEVDGLEGSAELVFPSPVTEQSVPGGAIILISLIILGAAYGGWYFLSSQDRSMAELVPDLPAKFAEMMDRVKDSKAEKTKQPEAQAPTSVEEKTDTAVSETDTQDMAKKALEAVEEAQIQEKEIVQTVETVKVEDVADKVIEPAVEVTKTVVEEIKKVVEPAVEEKVKPEAAVNETVEKVEEKIKEVVAVTEPEAEIAPEPKPVLPQVMNEKIVLKAVDYSWIQVTDSDGQVKHTQVLNEGDEYQIPPVQGLILRTGNAGGLEVFVNGEKAPALGDSGQVRRKILIDPAKLLAGIAVDS